MNWAQSARHIGSCSRSDAVVHPDATNQRTTGPLAREGRYYSAPSGADTCFVPGGGSKCDPSTGAELKFDDVICVSIKIPLVPACAPEAPFVF